ncbi:MAG: undecaprenyldiphospho-muramoylpentapeptide beta-N-acetylglucosaminyltransferase [Neisseria sp.]|nr:undecaprenyldiphospho-muramoylpentapeptide beta-N-acetylglucosaminyltransferase [Neisseria sp.]
MSKTFLMMAGGTGGHIFPALAVAQTLRAQGHRIVWLGSAGAMETRIVPQHDIPLETLAIKGVRGNGLLRKLLLPVTLFKTVQAALNVIKKHRVDGVIGFGGFVSFPGGVAAKIARIPLVIHEQNAVAGLSNRALAKIATRVLYAFPNALPYADGLVGNPVRAEIAAMPPPAVRFAAHTGSLKLLVVGGSLGAKVFNDTLPDIIAAMPPAQRPQVRHQCGRGNSAAVTERYRALGLNAECSDFIEDMVTAYAAADYVICRAGALTVAELAAAGLGGFLVPFPHAVDDHQTQNAQYLVQGNAAICIAQSEFTAADMAERLSRLSREQCLQYAANARALALPDAAQKMAAIAVACVQENG